MASGCSSCLGDGPSEVEALVDRRGIDCDSVRNGTLIARPGSRASPRSKSAMLNGGRAGRRSNYSAAKRPRGGSASISMPGLCSTSAPSRSSRWLTRAGLANAALAAGAGIHTQSPMRSAERTGKAWRPRRTGESVAADSIVVATDAYAEGANGRKASGSRAACPISTSPPGRSGLNSGPRSSRDGGRWDTQLIMNSFRFDKPGRIFGGIGALRLAGLEVHGAWAKRALKKTVPPNWLGRIRGAMVPG